MCWSGGGVPVRRGAAGGVRLWVIVIAVTIRRSGSIYAVSITRYRGIGALRWWVAPSRRRSAAEHPLLKTFPCFFGSTGFLTLTIKCNNVTFLCSSDGPRDKLFFCGGELNAFGGVLPPAGRSASLCRTFQRDKQINYEQYCDLKDKIISSQRHY